MSAHRRPAFRESPPGRRRAAGDHRPRTRSAAFRLLPVALGVALLGVGGVVGPSVIGAAPTDEVDRFALSALPTDAPEQGLVYSGLKLASKGSLCSGSYLLYEQTCTHGPDSAPAGLSVRRDVAPVTESSARQVTVVSRETGAVPLDAEIARDEGGSALTADAPALIPDAAPGQADFILGPEDVACSGDGRSGKRVQLLYLHESTAPSRYAKFLNSFRTWAAGVDAIYDASAGETGGSRHIRYVTTPECRVDVAEVQLPDDSLNSFTGSINALRDLGYNRTDRKYLIFSDANVYCGISSFVADTRPGRGNRNNGGPSYARVDAGCWSSAMAAHELTHTLGAVLIDSPNSTGAGSCTDDFDLLCGEDRSGKPVRNVCPKKHEIRLDCGNDDYFSTNPKKDSYLDLHWNVALSDFLLRSDGGDDIPDAPGAVVPDPTVEAAPPATSAPAATPVSPAPSTVAPSAPESPAAPSPSVSESVAPDAGVSESPAPEPSASVTGESTLPPIEEVAHTVAPAPADADTAEGAPAEAPGTTNDGVQAVLEIREATSTSVRLTWSSGADDAQYEVSVGGEPVATTKSTRARLIGLKPDAKYVVEVRNTKLGYLAKGTAVTAPAARPVQNSWFVLTNSLTGGAADLYAARDTDGTPVTLGDQDGGAQQQWQLVPAENGTYSLVSRASNRCAVALAGKPVAGAPLVQGDCYAADGARWTLQASDYGFTVRSTTGDLVIGVGAQRFGAHRVLVLQEDTGQRHQSWTAVPD
ncbi:RICIN domain-containing protein [Actinoplanes sp. CA-015351]|uniref:RICIN domain-containing protein n=1 Tax=Actinoplanes sp. CA-015351 TaxID=3239897 RepID=UPI003D976FC1